MTARRSRPGVVVSVLRSAAYHGDLPLFQSFLSEFKRTQDRQDQRRLITAMTEFRDPEAVQAGMQEVLSGRVKLADGFVLLFGGQGSPATRKMPFEFLKAHFDEIMKDNPSIFGNSFGSFLPRVGGGFCGMQQSAGRPRPLDRAPGSGRSRQTQIGSPRRKGNHSDSPAQPRSQAAAGKKCGCAPG